MSDLNRRGCPELGKLAREQVVVAQRDGVAFSSRFGVHYGRTFVARVLFVSQTWIDLIKVFDSGGTDNIAAGPRARYELARDHIKSIWLRMFGSKLLDGSFFGLADTDTVLDEAATVAFGDALLELGDAMDEFCRGDTPAEAFVDAAANLTGRGVKELFEGLGLSPTMLLIVGAGLVALAVSR